MGNLSLNAFHVTVIAVLLLQTVFSEDQTVAHVDQTKSSETRDSKTSETEKITEQTDTQKSTGETSGKIPVSSWQMYMKVFEQNRAVQLEAVKNMQAYGKYEQRYQLADIVIKQLMKVLAEAKVNVTQWGFVPGDPYPEETHVREAVSKVMENTAMFGDLALRLPDIVHSLYDKNREWQELIAWGVWFCNQTQVFEMSSASAMLLNLMSQELNLIERDRLYINPFTEENLKLQEEEIAKRLDAKKQIKLEKKKKKEKKRGPRMSGSARVEL
ncbi:coiled-coil domain-containing protein 134-like [Liolophura sinensis]|uniref:coiled-coil domain-containing protein 134-like n=1 Tax=Liolophura sinensis TaxID=3198878 RepID=UPI0031593246